MVSNISQVLLFDQDNTIGNFTDRFHEVIDDIVPEEFRVDINDGKKFFIQDYYPAHREEIMQAFASKNFFLGIKPIKGAIEAIKEVCDLGFQVKICTTPLNDYVNCVPEKYAWVEKYLGKDFVDNIILTHDKTIVQGRILVDDKPDITGANPNPTWKHVVFDQPYNRHLVNHKRIINWDNWRDVLDI